MRLDFYLNGMFLPDIVSLGNPIRFHEDHVFAGYVLTFFVSQDSFFPRHFSVCYYATINTICYNQLGFSKLNAQKV